MHTVSAFMIVKVMSMLLLRDYEVESADVKSLECVIDTHFSSACKATYRPITYYFPSYTYWLTWWKKRFFFKYFECTVDACSFAQF